MSEEADVEIEEKFVEITCFRCLCKVNIIAIGLNDGFEVLSEAMAEPSQRQKREEKKHNSKLQQPEEQPSPVH